MLILEILLPVGMFRIFVLLSCCFTWVYTVMFTRNNCNQSTKRCIKLIFFVWIEFLLVMLDILGLKPR